MKEQSVRVIQMPLWAYKREKFFHGWKYTPFYNKGTKETYSRAMETTTLSPINSLLPKCGWQTCYLVQYGNRYDISQVFVPFWSFCIVLIKKRGKTAKNNILPANWVCSMVEIYNNPMSHDLVTCWSVAKVRLSYIALVAKLCSIKKSYIKIRKIFKNWTN